MSVLRSYRSSCSSNVLCTSSVQRDLQRLFVYHDIHLIQRENCKILFCSERDPPHQRHLLPPSDYLQLYWSTLHLLRWQSAGIRSMCLYAFPRSIQPHLKLLQSPGHICFLCTSVRDCRGSFGYQNATENQPGIIQRLSLPPCVLGGLGDHPQNDRQW